MLLIELTFLLCINAPCIGAMPFLKSPRRDEPWKCSDELAQKKGILHTVYSVNGDEYTGEWLNNKKHGIVYCFVCFI